MKDLYSRCNEVLTTNFSSFDFKPMIKDVPKIANKWLFLPHGSETWELVNEINESIGVLDVETSCFRDGGTNWVLMGTVLTQSGLYLWNHKAIITGNENDWTEGQLLNVGTKLRVAIAHNSAFDRSRVQESYTNQIFWIDTMSLHNAQHIFCKDQRMVLTKMRDKIFKPLWEREGSAASLLDSYNFHVCHLLSEYNPLDESDKKLRNLFVKAKSFGEISLEYQKLAKYALLDVVYTGRLFDYVWKAWLNSTPHINSRLGQLAHMNTFVRLDSKGLLHYLDNCDKIYNKEINQLNSGIELIAEKLFKEWESHIEQDLLDAKSNVVPPQFKTKSGAIKKTVRNLTWLDLFGTPKTNQFLLGLSPNLKSLDWTLTGVKERLKPRWCTQAKSCQSVNGHLLLDLKWNDLYLLYTQDRGFYLENDTELPHPKKGDNNIVRIFSKTFFDYFEKGLIFSTNPIAHRVMTAVMKTSFWVGNRTRFKQCATLVSGSSFLPEIVAIGTTTRRASSKIWHVLPKPSVKKLGSGFMDYVIPEEGHVLLHADLDSVEAVIAALYNGLDNEFTNSVLFGVKELQTDVHSVNGKSFDITRSSAKEFLYQSIYGSGVRGLANTLTSNNPDINLAEATTMATRFLDGLRGKKVNGIYVGGTASTCFNKLISLIDEKTAGFLNNAYPYTLLSSVVGKDFFTSRANAGIQSVGRMMLDFWLSKTLEKAPWMEFYYSVHDQIIMSCPKTHIPQGIKAIQESHKETYFALLRFLEYDPESLPNLHYVTSVIQDTRLGKEPSSRGVEHFRLA